MRVRIVIPTNAVILSVYSNDFGKVSFYLGFEHRGLYRDYGALSLVHSRHACAALGVILYIPNYLYVVREAFP